MNTTQPGHGPQTPPKIAGVPIIPQKAEPDLSALSLVDEPPSAPVQRPPGSPAPAPQVSKIRQFSVAGAHAEHAPFKRQTTVGGHGAIRVRSFHGRLSDEGMAYMDDKINDWLDNHPDVEIKFVNTAIGLYEGKIREQALVVNIWY